MQGSTLVPNQLTLPPSSSPQTSTAPAALHSDRTTPKSTVTLGLIYVLALLVGTARLISAFGSRAAEATALSVLLDGVFPHTTLIDGAAGDGLSLGYCTSQGLLNGLSEMNKFLERLLGSPKKRNKSNISCTRKTYWSSLTLAAINAITTAFSAANGMFLLFGGSDPSIAVYSLAIFFAFIIFCSSTYFNWQKQLEGATQEDIVLKGWKKKLYPVMAGTSLLSNGVTTIYQSLLFLAFFGVANTNIGSLAFGLIMAIFSSFNLAFAQLPAIKAQLATPKKASYCSSRLPWYLPIIVACALTPFNSSVGLQDMLQAFTLLVINLGNLNPPASESGWYNSSAASWLIWLLGIILGLNAAYALYAYRGPEAKERIDAIVDKILCANKAKVTGAAAITDDNNTSDSSSSSNRTDDTGSILNAAAARRPRAGTEDEKEGDRDTGITIDISPLRTPDDNGAAAHRPRADTHDSKASEHGGVNAAASASTTSFYFDFSIPANSTNDYTQALLAKE